MLKPTNTVTATQTTYEIPTNTMLLGETYSVRRNGPSRETGGYVIRPTTVTVAEREGEIQGMVFHGPRQLGHDRDGRDSGSAVLTADEIFASANTGPMIIDAVLEMHLRHTVKVLDDDETRALLAKLDI